MSDHSAKLFLLLLLCTTPFLVRGQQLAIKEDPYEGKLIVRFTQGYYYTPYQNEQLSVQKGNKIVFKALHPFYSDSSKFEKRLEYIGPGDTARLREALNRDTIRDCYFDVPIAIRQLADKKAGGYRSRPLIITNCVFLFLTTDSANLTTRPLIFKKDVFITGMNVLGAAVLPKLTFEGKFRWSSPIGAVGITNSSFKGPASLCFVTMPNKPDHLFGTTFVEDSFSRTVIIEPSTADVVGELSFEKCKFYDLLTFGATYWDTETEDSETLVSPMKRIPIVDLNIDDSKSYFQKKERQLAEQFSTGSIPFSQRNPSPYSPAADSMVDISMTNCVIGKFDMSNITFAGSEFNDVTITDWIDTYEAKFIDSAKYDSSALAKMHFPYDGTRIITDDDHSILARHDLSFYLKNIDLHAYYQHFSDENYLDGNNRYYESIKGYCEKKFAGDKDLVVELKARIDRDKKLWALRYYCHQLTHPKSIGSFVACIFPLIGTSFLELTVRSGYKGEWNLAGWSMILILAFSLIYYRRNRLAIIEYLNVAFNKKKDDVKYERKIRIYKEDGFTRDYFRCLWFSFVIFLDPRFPLQLFNIPKNLLRIVLVEWTMGILSILLFFVYLASNYPFVRTLLGL